LPPHRGLASLSASGKDARQHVTVIGLGAVGIVSAIEAVRDGLCPGGERLLDRRFCVDFTLDAIRF
jgi:hypothetical protein